MANFDVTIRRDYKDVAGLVLDCLKGDLVSLDGGVERWVNRAPLAPAGFARFGDPFQDVVARRPEDASGVIRFDKSNTEFLKVPVVGTFPSSQDWGVAFEFAKGADVTDGQAILGSATAGDLNLFRRRAAGGNIAYEHSGGTVSSATIDLFDGVHQFMLNGGATVDWRRDESTIIFAAQPISNLTFPTGSAGMFIGRQGDGLTDDLDGDLSSMRVWRRILSVLERDFLWQSLGASGAPAFARMTVAHVPWTDETGDAALLGQIRRLNPPAGRDPLFALATGTFPARVQLSCQVGGELLPDSGLGGDLFVISFPELPGGPTLPAVFQDAGFSAIFDIVLTRPGHYTVLISRPSGGAKIVHLDARLGP